MTFERSARMEGGAPPAQHETFFIGTCVRVSENSALLDVRVQRYGSRMREVAQSARSLFPPDGEVELKNIVSGALDVGDWVAFHVVSQVPRGRFRVTQFRRLLPFEDLSNVGSLERIRRLLVEEGRASGRPGEAALRIGSRELVRVPLRRDSDGRWRARPVDEMGRLPVFLFEPKLCIALGSGSELRTFVDPAEPLQQIATLNWIRDADLVRRIVRSLTRTEEPEDGTIRRFAATLMKFADSLEGGAAAPGHVDPHVAQDILRIRSLAALMRDHQDILEEYFETIRGDAEITALIEARIAEAARESAEADRKRRDELIGAEVTQAVAVVRGQRVSEIEQETAELRARLTREVEQEAAARSLELAAKLAEEERRGREAIDAGFSRRRAELEAELAILESRRDSLLNDAASGEARHRKLQAAIAELSQQEASLQNFLELQRAEREAELERSLADVAARKTQEAEQRAAGRFAELDAELAAQERTRREALETALGKRRAELLSELSDLENRRASLHGDIDLLQQKQRGAEAQLAEMSSRLEAHRGELQSEIQALLEKRRELAGSIGDLESSDASALQALDADIREVVEEIGSTVPNRAERRGGGPSRSGAGAAAASPPVEDLSSEQQEKPQQPAGPKIHMPAWLKR